MTNILIFGLVLIAMVLYSRIGRVSMEKATLLKASGAVVVDVRTPGEFASDGGVGGAVNIPLDTLEKVFPGKYPDRATPVLVYCLSGARSKAAAGILKNLGYADCGDLGPVSRAREILGGK